MSDSEPDTYMTVFFFMNNKATTSKTDDELELNYKEE
jgi:hypothetical protein